MYHSISSGVSPRFKSFAVSPEVFARQMAFLAHHAYTPITVSQLAQARTSASTSTSTHLPARPVVLTFDDGYADFYSHALPVLRQHHFTATLYVTTDFVGSTSRWLQREGESHRPLLNWQQLSEIASSGIECGAHTQTHPHLDTLSPHLAYQQIISSKHALEDHLGLPVHSFAYPFGHYDRRVRDQVQSANFYSACAVTPALSTPSDDLFALSRIMILNRPDLTWFGKRLRGKGITILPRDPIRPWLDGVLRRLKARLIRFA